MRKAGRGPEKWLALKIFTRDTSPFKAPAPIPTGHLKEFYIDAHLDIADTPTSYNRVFREDFQVGTPTARTKNHSVMVDSVYNGWRFEDGVAG